MPEGIDVYTRYQRVTSWPDVRRAGYSYCYVKVSDGDEDRPDDGYGHAGRAAGLAMGAYHYAQFGDPVAQANRLVSRAEAAGLTDLAPALDLEAPFRPDRTAIDFAVAFLRQVRARGHRPCLYANNSMLSLLRWPVVAAVPETVIWVARYGPAPTVPYDVWQWSSSGRVPGITASAVDLNRGDPPLNNFRTTTSEDDMTPDQERLLRDVHEALFTKRQPSRIPGDKNTTILNDAIMDTVARVSMNQGALAQANAKLDGLAAAVAALANDPDLDLATVKQIVQDAVKQNLEITGTVQIGASE